MKIKVVKQIVKDKDNSEYDYDIISYKIKSIYKCCDDIINNPAIELSSQYDQTQNQYLYGVFLAYGFNDYDGERNSTEYDYCKINCCPFCGQKIDIENIEVIDISDEYYRLKSERDKIYKNWISCDSIKRASELKSFIKEYDNKIHELLKNDGFEIFGEISATSINF